MPCTCAPTSRVRTDSASFAPSLLPWGSPAGELNGIDILGRRGAGIQTMLDRAQAGETLTVLDIFERVIIPIYLRVMFGAEDALTDRAMEELARRALRP